MGVIAEWFQITCTVIGGMFAVGFLVGIIGRDMCRRGK